MFHSEWLMTMLSEFTASALLIIVVGAICINIDVNYIDAYVLSAAERTAEFFRQYCHVDMHLDENILSKDEYRQAQAGKKHFRDSAPPVP